MKQILLLFVLSIACQVSYAQQNTTPQQAEKEIRLVIQKQEQAWNNYDLDEFMEGYWKSDSLMFVSPQQVTNGWAVTFQNYRLKYSNQVEIGSLKFDILDVRPLTQEVYVVTGSYFITRTTTNLNGLFTLLFQKKHGKWVIVYDHTS